MSWDVCPFFIESPYYFMELWFCTLWYSLVLSAFLLLHFWSYHLPSFGKLLPTHTHFLRFWWDAQIMPTPGQTSGNETQAWSIRIPDRPAPGRCDWYRVGEMPQVRPTWGFMYGASSTVTLPPPPGGEKLYEVKECGRCLGKSRA